MNNRRHGGFDIDFVEGVWGPEPATIKPVRGKLETLVS
jgi:hypothetical protein